MNSSSSSNFTNFTNFTTITNWSAATNQSSPLPNTPRGGVNVPTKDLPKGCLAPYKPKLLTREQIVNRIQKQQQREEEQQRAQKEPEMQAKMKPPRLEASADRAKKEKSAPTLPENLFNPTKVERMQKGRHLLVQWPQMPPMGDGFPKLPFKSNHPQGTLGHVKEFAQYCGSEVFLSDNLPKSMHTKLGGIIVLIGDPNHWSIEVDKLETFLVLQNMMLSEKGDGDIVLAEGKALCRNLETVLPMIPGGPKSAEKFCLDIEDGRFHNIIEEAREQWMDCANQLLALIGVEETRNPEVIVSTLKARKDEIKSSAESIGRSELFKQEADLYVHLNHLLETTQGARDEDMLKRIKTAWALNSKSAVFANCGLYHSDNLYQELKKLPVVYVRPSKWSVGAI